MKKILTLALTILLLTSCAFQPASSGGYDPDSNYLDLTVLNSNMVYAEVNHMMQSPHDYEGKQVKMQGLFNTIKYKKQVNFTCIIQDATACCAQGIEFVCKDDLSYPGEYPQEQEEIVVTGTFEVYADKGYEYVRLKDAVINP